MAAVPGVPALYRYWFLYADPLLAAYSTYIDVAAPAVFLDAYLPDVPFDARYQPLFTQLGGGLACCALLSAALPRVAPRDLRAWQTLQAGILAFDALLLRSSYEALARRGRLDPRGWSGADAGAVGLVLFVALLRAAFLAGVGLRGAGAAAGRGRKAA